MDNMVRSPRPTRPREQPPTATPVVVEELRPTPEVRPIHPRDEHVAAPLLIRRRRRLLGALISVSVVLLLSLVVWFLYLSLLEPVDRSDSSAQKIEIASGQSFGEIAQTLESRNLIKNTLAFELMARLSGKRNDVKAGTCTLNRTESAMQILDKITSGCYDFKSITFYPGATIYKSRSKPTSMDVTDILLKAGYSQAEIDSALAKSYTTKGIDLFAGKPADMDLEGYIYGDTYYVDTDATVEEVLQTSFDQMASDIQEGGYVEKFRANGLTLYEGITLASIVQRELSCTTDTTTCVTDQEKIAQIFYTRLAIPMTLGSDVTFYYAADKLGVDPATDIDSPYNTRRYRGLPPGPIASPGKYALDAVANPALTDYLFFIAGDDGKVYYAQTDEEHNENVAKYCQKLCSEL